MNTTWIIVSLAIGAVLGAIYFAGLWITVRRLAITRQPALLMLVSFIGRVAVVLLGFYFVTDGRWERLIACLAGFLLARTLLIRRLHDVGQDSGFPALPDNAKRTIG